MHHLAQLPDELLAEILNWATLTGDAAQLRPRKRDYDAIQSLSRVSQRFHRVVTPFLYEEIRFAHPTLCQRCMVPPMAKARKLHRLLQLNPALRPLCVSLYIDIDDSGANTEENFQILDDMVSWFTRLRSLVVVGGFFSKGPERVRERTLSLIHRTKSLKQLKEFKIEGNMWDEIGGVSLAETVKYANSDTLQTLEISAAGLSKPSAISEMLSPQISRSASFNSVRLMGCKDYPEAIAALIHWPKELVHFTINTSGSFVSDMNLHDIGMCLSVHKDTLKSIYIDLLGFPHGLSFNAANFPQLEVLRLSRTQICEDPWNRKFDWEPVYADLLLGPNLHTFGLVFGVMGHSLINNWGHKEEEWIRQLAKAAWKRKAALKTIEITFSPVSPYPNLKQGIYSDWEYVYPWDRMDKLGNQIQRYGLTLEYTAPPWTKEEWLSEVNHCSHSVIPCGNDDGDFNDA
ncbi:hypothetical protein N7456_013227 [Penicillium angulare]|uniref:F-box domain-containing protein n=1 Tax=Penicillium angulare TaxID=116970 RepID=A0A9W9ELB2_9EURO|nr:hypothetical protein N7456_013227 [Penicillium angulare]